MVILGSVGSMSDRYMPSGYGSHYSNEELLDRLGEIESLHGIELCYGSNVTEKNLPQVGQRINGLGLKAVSIIPNLFGTAEWGKGSVTSKDCKHGATGLSPTPKRSRI